MEMDPEADTKWHQVPLEGAVDCEPPLWVLLLCFPQADLIYYDIMLNIIYYIILSYCILLYYILLIIIV